jgi:hypothetical protein
MQRSGVASRLCPHLGRVKIGSNDDFTDYSEGRDRGDCQGSGPVDRGFDPASSQAWTVIVSAPIGGVTPKTFSAKVLSNPADLVNMTKVNERSSVAQW